MQKIKPKLWSQWRFHCNCTNWAVILLWITYSSAVSMYLLHFSPIKHLCSCGFTDSLISNRHTDLCVLRTKISLLVPSVVMLLFLLVWNFMKVLSHWTCVVLMCLPVFAYCHPAEGESSWSLSCFTSMPHCSSSVCSPCFMALDNRVRYIILYKLLVVPVLDFFFWKSHCSGK